MKLAFLISCCLFSGIALAQDLSLFEKHVYGGRNSTMPYRLLKPKDAVMTEKYPLVIFLHGSGERGNDNEKQLVHGAKMFLRDSIREQYPAYVLFPQCPSESYWSNVDIVTDPLTKKRSFNFKSGGKPTSAMKDLQRLVKEFIRDNNIDEDRVYIAGLSMGAMGTFEIVRRNPKMFAAAIAICGGADPATAKKLTQPFWQIFHGEKDDIVDPAFSRAMYATILQAKGNASITLYADANHNSWDRTFAEPQLLPKLFDVKR